MADRRRDYLGRRHSLRRRMAFVFAAAVFITALALSLAAYFITKTAQDNEALDKALAQSRFNLFLADAMLPAEPASTDYNDLLDAFKMRGDFATLIKVGGDVYVSGPQITTSLITSELAAKVEEGRIGYQAIAVAGEPTIAVGAQVRSPDLVFYFFYPQGARLADLARLRTVLVVGGLLLAALGAIAGLWLARGLLGPIREASEAAVRMSQGDLDTRLPAGTDELGVMGDSFNRMAGNLQAKMLDLEAGQARERRFVADVAHELRTPVSALVGEASLLKSRLEAKPDVCPPEISQLAQLVSTDISRLRQLVDDLLEISRLDAQAAELLMEPLNLRSFLRQLVEAHGWSGSGAVVVEPGSAGGFGDVQAPGRTEQSPAEKLRFATAQEMLTDKRRLERIIVNLVENALTHGAMPVIIETREQLLAEDPGTLVKRGVVRIAVTDSGRGIPADHLPHVFDRFYKADPSRSTSRGSGLGLAIARENARLLGGDLTVGNVPGGGARFVLTLPI